MAGRIGGSPHFSLLNDFCHGLLTHFASPPSDTFPPPVNIWRTLRESPETLKEWYRERWEYMDAGHKVERYEVIKASYNAGPNAADLLFLCRSCYGGVVRFRKADGYMSTPCGIHRPIRPESFARRVDEWYRRTAGATFARMEYAEAIEAAKAGDLVYCDPPYSHSQAILYGAQSFNLEDLLGTIDHCKSKGVFVALLIPAEYSVVFGHSKCLARAGAARCAPTLYFANINKHRWHEEVW